MWRKATCYKSATFAAFVVGSSLALLTGAQAEELTLVPNANSTITFTSTTQQIAGTAGSTDAISRASLVNIGGTATFGNFSAPFSFTSSQSGLVGQWDGTNFTALGAAIVRLSIPPNQQLLNGNRAIVDLTMRSILNANTDTPTIVGTYSNQTSNLGSFNNGIFAPGGAFPTTGTFDLPLTTSGSLTLAMLLPTTTPPGTTTGSGVSVIATVGTGGGLNIPAAPPVPDIPLPPAIYLFGSVLGSAFWLGRRKRSAVNSLGA